MIRWIKTHPYCLINLYLVFYLIGFFALEAFVPEPKYIIHSALDDWIPFNEWFVLPYFFMVPVGAGISSLFHAEGKGLVSPAGLYYVYGNDNLPDHIRAVAKRTASAPGYSGR